MLADLGYHSTAMELHQNPYQPPTTEEPFSPPGDLQSGQLASRGSRLAAAMIDGVAVVVVFVPLQWSFGIYDDFARYSQNALAQALWGLGAFGIMLAINGYLLATRAQTVGKVALGIKIVTLDGKNADLGRIVLRRMIPPNVLALIPGVGRIFPFVDALAIFRKDRRCLHDHIAGTIVVRA